MQEGTLSKQLRLLLGPSRSGLRVSGLFEEVGGKLQLE